jgi:hypothetical protein
VKKGLILNELVQCGRRIGVFEAFTTEESVLQLGLQKMHNVHVHVGRFGYKKLEGITKA